MGSACSCSCSFSWWFLSATFFHRSTFVNGRDGNPSGACFLGGVFWFEMPREVLARGGVGGGMGMWAVAGMMPMIGGLGGETVGELGEVRVRMDGMGRCCVRFALMYRWSMPSIRSRMPPERVCRTNACPHTPLPRLRFTPSKPCTGSSRPTPLPS